MDIALKKKSGGINIYTKATPTGMPANIAPTEMPPKEEILEKRNKFDSYDPAKVFGADLAMYFIPDDAEENERDNEWLL